MLEHLPACCATVIGHLDTSAARAQEQRIAQGGAQDRFAVEKQAQRRHRQSCQCGRAASLDANADGGTRIAGQAQRWRRRQRGLIADICQTQRRHRHVIRGGELAGDAMLFWRMHDGATRYDNWSGIRMAVTVDAGNRTGGKRPQIVRKIQFQQRIAELAKCIVEPLGSARIEHGIRLQHARQIRIAHFATGHAERAGQGRIAPRKCLIVRSQRTEFPFVVLQQLVHARPLLIAAITSILKKRPPVKLRINKFVIHPSHSSRTACLPLLSIGIDLS